MKLWIASEIFDTETLFPKGFLAFCFSIKNEGFDLGTDTSALTPDQHSQLEELLADFKSSEAQLTLSPGYTLSLGKIKIASTSNLFQLFGLYQKNLERKASIQRKTNETDISIDLNLDGTGIANIDTGLKFFDHMLDQIAKHGFVDLDLTCKGDLEVDEHHTIEDVAIALGEAITEALGDKKGIERYAFVLPMDEAQATISLDLSGRPYLVFEGEFTREYVGDFPTEMVKHFFYSLAMNLKATLQIEFKGENDHHKIEACFKGFARTLKTAVEKNPRIKHRIPSSKGTL